MQGTTGIMSALAEEQLGLLDLLVQAHCVSHAGREFWLGRLQDHAVVLALSRIGKVAAATTAAALIERFGASRIVFTGVAGGLGQDVQVGDLVVGREYLQHDMDASPLFPRYEVPLYGCARFAADPALLARLAAAARVYLEQAATAPDAGTDRTARLHLGLVASGDRFVASAAQAHALRAELPDALCVEMEGAAVAQVCRDYAVPFCAVRTISDRADDSAHVDFSRFVRSMAGPHAVGIVGALMQRLG